MDARDPEVPQALHQSYFDDRRNSLKQGEADLAQEVADACPGPHRVTQKRDRNPPWCETCGRGRLGKLIAPRG